MTYLSVRMIMILSVQVIDLRKGSSQVTWSVDVHNDKVFHCSHSPSSQIRSWLYEAWCRQCDLCITPDAMRLVQTDPCRLHICLFQLAPASNVSVLHQSLLTVFVTFCIHHDMFIHMNGKMYVISLRITKQDLLF